MALASVGAIRGGAVASAGAAGARSGRGASAGGRGFASAGASSPLSGHATYAAAIRRAQEGTGAERTGETGSNEGGRRSSVKNKGRSLAEAYAKTEGKLDAYIRSFENPTAEAAEKNRDRGKAAGYAQASASINKTVMSAAGSIGGAAGSVLAGLFNLAQQQQPQPDQTT